MTGGSKTLIDRIQEIDRIQKKMDELDDRELLDDPDVKEVFSEVIIETALGETEPPDENFILEMLDSIRKDKYIKKTPEQILMKQILMNQAPWKIPKENEEPK